MKNDNLDSLQRSLAALLIVAAVATAAGHVFTVERVYEPSLTRAPGEESSPYPRWPEKRPLPTPLLRSNDRSRWCTIRALVDEGTYVIGRRDPAQATASNPYGDTGIVFEDGWTSVDKVLPNGKEFYSSKPPFLPTLLAGEYWLMKHAFGWSLGGDGPARWWVVRIILLTVNVLPLAFYLVLLDRLAEWLGTSGWGRFFVLVSACFGTFVTSFAGALNNHVMATCCVIFAMDPILRILCGGPRHDTPWRYAIGGFFTAFAACNELPAAALATALLVVLLTHAPGKTLVWFLPAATLPVAGFFLCNYLAIGQLMPAYEKLGGPWYAYPGSNFNPNAPLELRRGIDWAKEKESYGMYLFHFFIGHHGIFSLTPVWLLVIPGIGMGLVAGKRNDAADYELSAETDFARARRARWLVAAITLFVSVVVVAFYAALAPRNYSGWTIGPRWLMWLTPLWLLTLLPVADRLGGSRGGRIFACVLLGFSVLSAVPPAGNPWHHPWIYTIWEQSSGPLY
jgi:hypothetical protein